MFQYKTEAELQAMTPEQRDAYAAAKREFEAKATKIQIDEALAQFKKDNPVPDVTELKTKIEAQKTEITELREQLKQMKEGGTPASAEPRAALVKQIKEKKDELKSMLKSMTGAEVELKALSNRASIATNPHQLLVDGIPMLGRIARGLYNLFTKIQVGRGNHNGTIAYVDWDESTTVNAAATVAEGNAFPESTAKFKGYTLSLRKIGDTLPVTEEFFEDEEMAAGELEMFVNSNVESKIDSQLANGDGTGENLTGLIASVPAFTAVNSNIQAPNIYDLIVKVREDITKTQGSKYNPDFAAMSLTTINKLVLAKDANENYLFPPSHPIYGFITEDNNIPDNQMVVGDSRYGVIYEMGGVTLTRGLVGDQFKEDKMTIKARKRMAFLIRNQNKTGFRKVTDVQAAVDTLGGV
ncbi:MAG: hypothetical protein B7Z54_02580 [Sphingobacteriales bacterium 12-47-4]|nr:MAG: hypothetical protein B7Z54_02580 [Sphingobacteriales bacterium 12-47-4]